MSIAELSDHLQNRPFQLQEEKENGKKVVGFFPGNYLPEEVIYAAGAVPVGLIHAGSAGSAEAGLSRVPQIFCPFARALIGERLSDRNPIYAAVDLLVAPLTCQHLKKVAELWEYEGDLGIFKLGIPFQHKNEFESAYFVDRINDLRGRLEALTGNEITREKLAGAIELYNRMRGLLKKISLLRRGPEIVISAKDFIALNHGSYYADPKFMVELLEKEYRRLEGLSGDVPDDISSDQPRILFMGPNIGYGDDKVRQLIEGTGGRIVIEEFCEGMRYYWRNIDTRDDPVPSLARAYLIDRLPCAFMRDSTRPRLEFALELIKDFKVDGVIWYELVCCETYDSEGYYFSREMGKRDIPFLVLESDYTKADVGQLRTRIEAFIEIVKGVV